MFFNFSLPTNIYFGKNSINKILDIINIKSNILFITGKSSIFNNGIWNKILDILKSNPEIKYKLFNDIEPNPSIETINKGYEFAKNENFDYIITIGGGSALDAAKGISLLLTNGGKIEDYIYDNKPINYPIIPIIAIPTTSGTGSEVTQYAVFIDNNTKEKVALGNPALFPKYALIDPLLAQYQNKELTINTAIDALSHLVEAFLSTKCNPIIELLALKGIDLITRVLARQNEFDYETLSYSSMLGGITISQAGTILLHALGYPLTSYFGIPHGRANAIMFQPFIDFIKYSEKEKTKAIFNILNRHRFKNFDDLCQKLSISTKLNDYDIYENHIEKFVKSVITKKNLLITPCKVTENEIRNIYLSRI